MTNVFSELSQRDPGLAEDFNCNAEVQKVLIKNGEHLLGNAGLEVSLWLGYHDSYDYTDQCGVNCHHAVYLTTRSLPFFVQVPSHSSCQT